MFILVNLIEVDENWEEQFEAWKDGRTGYPFIDAIMRQLKEIGWMHHLARHAVACFLTRGDLWISWEHGRDHFGAATTLPVLCTSDH